MSPARFRVIVSSVLTVGVVVSSVLMTLAFVGSIAVGWDGSLRGMPAQTVSASDFPGAVPGLVELRPIALAQAGLLVLVATPVARVIASVIAFALERDRFYVGITLAVLAILCFSLFGLH